MNALASTDHETCLQVPKHILNQLEELKKNWQSLHEDALTKSFCFEDAKASLVRTSTSWYFYILSTACRSWFPVQYKSILLFYLEIKHWVQNEYQNHIVCIDQNDVRVNNFFGVWKKKNNWLILMHFNNNCAICVTTLLWLIN